MVRYEYEIEREMRIPAPIKDSKNGQVLYAAARLNRGDFLVVRLYGAYRLYQLSGHGYWPMDAIKVLDGGLGTYYAEPSYGSVRHFAFHGSSFQHPTIEYYNNRRIAVLHKYSPTDFEFQLHSDGSIRKSPIMTDIPLLPMADMTGLLQSMTFAIFDAAMFGEGRELYLSEELLPDVHGLFDYMQGCLNGSRRCPTVRGPQHLLTTFRWLAHSYRFFDTRTGFENMLSQGCLIQSALLSYLQAFGKIGND